MAALVGSLRARWREGSALSVSGLSQQLQRTLVLANANLLRQGSLLDKKKKKPEKNLPRAIYLQQRPYKGKGVCGTFNKMY